MKKIIALLILQIILVSCTTYPAGAMSSDTAPEQWCAQMGGENHFQLQGEAPIHCLTDQYAIEAMPAHRWAEAIGLTLYYAELTGREPGVVLLMQEGEQDTPHLLRLLGAIKASPKRWRVWVKTQNQELQAVSEQ